jgi:hypothetical protein
MSEYIGEPGPELVVKKLPAYIVVPDDFQFQLTFEELMQRAAKYEATWRALPQEVRERIAAERKATYEAERCPQCGCHPDEHADG